MLGTINEPTDANLASLNNADIRSAKGNVHFPTNPTEASTTASPSRAPEDGGSEEDKAQLDWDDE
jgi:hypothetical protein